MLSTMFNWLISVQTLLLLYAASGTGAFSVTTHIDQQGNNFRGKVRNRFVASTDIRSQVDNTSSEPDLFDYFDPLLSPHAYPKGIVPKSSTSQEPKLDDFMDSNNSSDVCRVDNDDFGWRSREFDSSLKKSYVLKKPFGIALPLEEESEYAGNIASPSRIASVGAMDSQLIDTATIFDPTLSPHFYSQGRVPDVIVGDEIAKNIAHDTPSTSPPPLRGTVGLLLIDHGSRSAESNQRLQDLARLYQEQYATVSGDSASSRVNVIVKAAHMEIATPSIEDGLSALLEANVEEIICHPYFLSPGRHVVEDIPRIIAAAMDSLSITIPVRTTPPIGSRTNMMMEAIHALVQETTKL